jgi:hypothetical protein
MCLIVQTRKPLNASHCGAIRSGEFTGDWHLYKCKIHDTTDCKTCFDWVKLIVAQEKKMEKGQVDDRDVLLRLLKAMEVEFPPTYKAPAELLDHKLKVALDLSQDIKVVETIPINPDKLPRWSVRLFSILEA